jgi:hypothetical protein
LFENVIACTPVQEISWGYFVFGGLIVRVVAFRDGYEVLGLRIRERTEEDGVDDTENGGVGADAEGEGENGDGGESGIFAEYAEGKADVAGESFEEEAGALFANVFLGFFNGAESDVGAAFGFRAGKAGAFEVVGVAGDVGAEFFVKVGVEIGATKESGEEFAEVGEQAHFSPSLSS